MRVRFPRLADHQRGYAVVERDDGVVYRMDGFTVMGPDLPHDVRHLIVERELRVSDGIFGAIAAGTVWTSMHHLRGRRPPHSADRSEQLKKAQRDRIRRAELLANLVEAIAALDDPSPGEINQIARVKLSVVPVVEPGADPADVLASYRHVGALAAAGSLTLPTATYSLDEAPRAWEAQVSSPGKKIVVIP